MDYRPDLCDPGCVGLGTEFIVNVSPMFLNSGGRNVNTDVTTGIPAGIRKDNRRLSVNGPVCLFLGT